HGVVLPTPAPISMKLASADVEKGRTTFTRLCAGCHNHEPQGGNKTGPNLWSVAGRTEVGGQYRTVAQPHRRDRRLGWASAHGNRDLPHRLRAGFAQPS
ncbi:c-type cytochrome, partial [Mesorhizobium sp. M2D.F.Ca.ET.225.01.1.1]